MAYDIPPKPLYSHVQQADQDAAKRAQKAVQDALEDAKKAKEEADQRRRELEQATNNKGNIGTSQRK